MYTSAVILVHGSNLEKKKSHRQAEHEMEASVGNIAAAPLVSLSAGVKVDISL